MDFLLQFIDVILLKKYVLLMAISQWDNKNVGSFKEAPGKEVEVVWLCYANRGALYRKEGGGNVSTKEKNGRKAEEKSGQ